MGSNEIKNEAKRLAEELPENAACDDPMYRFGLHSELAAWHKVYEGLSDDEIAEVEAMALDRNR